MLKKNIITLFVIVLCFSLTGCSLSVVGGVDNSSVDVLEDKYTVLSKGEILEILDQQVQCDKKEVSAEFGVLGEPIIVIHIF